MGNTGFENRMANRWATGKTGRVMFAEIDKPLKPDPLNQLKKGRPITHFSILD